MRQFAACWSEQILAQVCSTHISIVSVHDDLVFPSPCFRFVLELGDIDGEHDRIHRELDLQLRDSRVRVTY